MRILENVELKLLRRKNIQSFNHTFIQSLNTNAFSGISVYVLLSISLFALIGIFALRDFMLEHAITCLGIFLLPVLARTQKVIFSVRYIWPALLFIALAFFSPAKTLAYFAWIFTFFLLAETFIGKLNYLPLFTAIVASPVFNYFLNVFGFSLRLQITQAASKILSILGSVSTEGNSIIFRGEEFSVDPACMGLNLTATALIFGILFLFRIERKHNISLPFFFTLAILSLFFLLNVFANLFRIVLLVNMRIMPEALMHEIIGFLCLGVYVILPGYFIVQYLSRRFVKEESSIFIPGNQFKKPVIFIFFLAFILMIFTSFRKTEWKEKQPITQTQSNGYIINYLPNDITKIENSNVLIYRKKISEFYSTEHNPMICWTGSGYHFQKVKESNIAGNTVYAGLLVKGKDTLHTAWWYSNGSHKTISQLDWRWRVMRGESKFYLMNVSAESEEMLEREILKFKKQ
ncbi:MAG: exosortase N [Bacteroidia bacterium]